MRYLLGIWSLWSMLLLGPGVCSSATPQPAGRGAFNDEHMYKDSSRTPATPTSHGSASISNTVTPMSADDMLLSLGRALGIELSSIVKPDAHYISRVAERAYRRRSAGGGEEMVTGTFGSAVADAILAQKESDIAVTALLQSNPSFARGQKVLEEQYNRAGLCIMEALSQQTRDCLCSPQAPFLKCMALVTVDFRTLAAELERSEKPDVHEVVRVVESAAEKRFRPRHHVTRRSKIGYKASSALDTITDTFQKGKDAWASVSKIVDEFKALPCKPSLDGLKRVCLGCEGCIPTSYVDVCIGAGTCGIPILTQKGEVCFSGMSVKGFHYCTPPLSSLKNISKEVAADVDFAMNTAALTGKAAFSKLVSKFKLNTCPLTLLDGQLFILRKQLRAATIISPIPHVIELGFVGEWQYGEPISEICSRFPLNCGDYCRYQQNYGKVDFYAKLLSFYEVAKVNLFTNKEKVTPLPFACLPNPCEKISCPERTVKIRSGKSGEFCRCSEDPCKNTTCPAHAPHKYSAIYNRPPGCICSPRVKTEEQLYAGIKSYHPDGTITNFRPRPYYWED